jgi:hypothetical protein
MFSAAQRPFSLVLSGVRVPLAPPQKCSSAVEVLRAWGGLRPNAAASGCVRRNWLRNKELGYRSTGDLTARLRLRARSVFAALR